MSNKAEDLKNRMRNKKPTVQERAIFPNGLPDQPLDNGIDNNDNTNTDTDFEINIDSNIDSNIDKESETEFSNENNILTDAKKQDQIATSTKIDTDTSIDDKNDNNNYVNFDTNNNVDNISDIETDNDIDDDYNIDIDSKIDSIFQTKKKREDEVTYRGFYIENDLVRVLDKLAKQHGKGVKSELVNGLLRKEFIARKLLK